jgi:hypothetical protein
MSIDEKYKESNKLLLLVRGDLEKLETEKDTSVFLQGMSCYYHNYALYSSLLRRETHYEPQSLIPCG